MDRLNAVSPSGWIIIGVVAIILTGMMVGEPSGSSAAPAAPRAVTEGALGTSAHPAKPVVMRYGFGDDRCTVPAGPAGIRIVECPESMR